MKLFSFFLCIFLIILVLGSVSYMMILWQHYILRWKKNMSLEKGYTNVILDEKVYENSEKYLLAERLKKRRRKSETTDAISISTPSIIEDPPCNISREETLKNAQNYGTQLSAKLRSTLIESGNALKNGLVKNVYGVEYRGRRYHSLKIKESSANLVCDSLAEIQLEDFIRGDAFFAKEDSLDRFLPMKSLFNQDTAYETCGVVSNAGSLLNSGLGSRIDSEDFIIRFNNAPIGSNFKKDVGEKTNLRIINSQVVYNARFKFLEAELYSAQPILVWDPSKYDSSVEQWYRTPDYPFFQNFFNHRLMSENHSRSAAYLLNPKSLWSAWNWLQSWTKYSLLPNPPSSGFLGLLVALRICKIVRIYEYVPSVRLSNRCHYYDEEDNMGCSIGDWHPLAAEKLMALAMNTNDDVSTYADGIIQIPGLASLKCNKKTT